MDKSTEAQSSQFDEKVIQLIEKYESLEEKLQQKNNDLIKAYALITELRENNANLKSARALSVTEKEREESKQRLTGMMREIDRCITLLTT